MAKNIKVTSPNSLDDELDDENEVANLIKKYGKEAATRIMKLDELDETLKSQEELLRLEREKFEALEKNLTNERKKNKKLEDSLKTKDGILLEVEESLTSEKEK
jgi:hypothetical protein